MKLQINAAWLLLALACAWPTVQSANLSEWELFKAKFNRTYATREQEAKALGRFKVSLRIIEKHRANASTAAMYSMELNEYADWSKRKADQVLPTRVDPARVSDQTEDWENYQSREFLRKLRQQDPRPVPTAFDWRQVPGRVGRVKNQGRDCGSCWAFATTGLLEGQLLKQTNSSELLELSEQNLIDCSGSNNGCDGGSVYLALNDTAKMGGIGREKDYPYQGHNQVCRANKSDAVLKVAGYWDLGLVNFTEKDLAEVVFKFGPVSVGINENRRLFLYRDGVFSDPTCDDSEIDHTVLLVGFGTDPRRGDYWIVKNSRGPNWGMGGYFHMARGLDMCGVLVEPVIPRF